MRNESILSKAVKIEKGVSIPKRPRKFKTSEFIDSCKDVEHGDSFFVEIPIEDVKHFQSRYSVVFSYYKGRIGKSHLSLKSRSQEGGIRFWFIDKTKI